MSDISKMQQRRAVGAIVLSIIAALPLFLGLLLGTVYFYTINKSFYIKEYAKYNNAEVIGVSDETLDEITDVLIDYIRGTRDNMDYQGERNGVVQEIYSQRAKDHMVDVLFLFDLARIVMKGCAIAFLLLLAGVIVLAAKKKHVYACAKVFMLSLLFLSVLFLVLVGIFALDFKAAFIKFHHIFFTNDLWLLEYNDVLVNMVPNGFFIDICIAIAITFGAMLAFCVVVCLIIMGRTRKYINTEKNRPTAEEIFENMGIKDESMVPQQVKELYTDTRVLQMAIEEQKQIDAQLNEPSTQDFDEMEQKSIQPPAEVNASVEVSESDLVEETVSAPKEQEAEKTVLVKETEEESENDPNTDESKLRERLRRIK